MEAGKTSSTVIVETGEHLFKVHGHSLITGDNTHLTSETFRVGGHDWAILYYPNGDPSIVDGRFTSVFLQLVSTIESDVTSSLSFCLQIEHHSRRVRRTRKAMPKILAVNDRGLEELGYKEIYE